MRRSFRVVKPDDFNENVALNEAFFKTACTECHVWCADSARGSAAPKSAAHYREHRLLKVLQTQAVK